MNENLSKKIDLFSFMFSLFVVWGHMTYVAHTDTMVMQIATKFVSNLVAMAMGYFFFISGYLFYRNYDLSMTIIKWKSRAKSLLIPYMFWNVLAFVVLVLLRIIGLSHPWTWFLDINKLADGPLWYVLCIMIYFAFAPVIFILIRKKKWFWTIFIGLAGMNLVVDYGIFERYLYYLPVFVLGAGIAIHYRETFENVIGNCLDVQSDKNNWIKGILAFITVCILFCALSFIKFPCGYRVVKMMIRVLTPIIIFFLFRKCSVDRYCKAWKGSFFIFCSHEILNSIIIQNKWIQYIFNNFYWASNTMFGFSLYAITIILIIMILYLGLRKLMPRFCTIICGGR